MLYPKTEKSANFPKNADISDFNTVSENVLVDNFYAFSVFTRSHALIFFKYTYKIL